jgi:hypothetical protein
MAQTNSYALDELGRSSPQLPSTEGDLQERLIAPQIQPATQGSVQKNSRGQFPTSYSKLAQNAPPIRDLLRTFTISLVVAIIYIIFIYYVLIQGTAQVGRLYFNASVANFLVSIFSQISASLADLMIRSLFGSLRHAFAARKDGISAPTFLGLGPDAGWLQVLNLALADRLFNFWCDFRYILF